MYIKDHMTKNPITIAPDTTVSKALDIMAANKFHRLPVVNAAGELIGLITEGLISDSSGEKTTSLSIYELNYLLSRTRVKDIMIKDVVTVSPDAFLEEAAQLLADNGIGVLPVLDDSRKVIGILTDKDVFTALTEIMGYRNQGTRFVIACEDKPGTFLKVCELFYKENANMENIAIYRTEERGVEVVVKATGEVSVETMTNVIRDAGYEVRNVVQTEKSGNRIVWVKGSV